MRHRYTREELAEPLPLALRKHIGYAYKKVVLNGGIPKTLNVFLQYSFLEYAFRQPKKVLLEYTLKIRL